MSIWKDSYLKKIEEAYIDKENEYNDLLKYYENEIQNAKNKLKSINNSISAGIALQEREQENSIEYYKLEISNKDLEDIKKLISIKDNLFNPILLNKLIWSEYFQKQTNELCNRVFGVNKKCGIYKITNTVTSKCYIGQSVFIQDRIKTHIKCGLGINTPSMNKLYTAMLKYGVWNFRFELVEECEQKELNQKEKQWIEVYQSNNFGYNSTGGNK